MCASVCKTIWRPHIFCCSVNAADQMASYTGKRDKQWPEMVFQCDRKNMVNRPFQFRLKVRSKVNRFWMVADSIVSYIHANACSHSSLNTQRKTSDGRVTMTMTKFQSCVSGDGDGGDFATFLPTVDINCRFHFLVFQLPHRVSAIQSFDFRNTRIIYVLYTFAQAHGWTLGGSKFGNLISSLVERFILSNKHFWHQFQIFILKTTTAPTRIKNNIKIAPIVSSIHGWHSRNFWRKEVKCMLIFSAWFWKEKKVKFATSIASTYVSYHRASAKQRNRTDWVHHTSEVCASACPMRRIIIKKW